MKPRGVLVTSLAGAAVVLAGAGVLTASLIGPRSDSSDAVSPPAAPATSAPASSSVGSDTASSLLYMMEEEKLAHDVYLTLADTWGANIFSNITRSETTHQELLVPLLESRGIVDPRSSEVGVFTDPELQALYDQLIAQGRTSYPEAIQVGLIIEKKDIADLNEALDLHDDADIVSVYQRLLSGSQNHLSAFERQA